MKYFLSVIAIVLSFSSIGKASDFSDCMALAQMQGTMEAKAAISRQCLTLSRTFTDCAELAVNQSTYEDMEQLSWACLSKFKETVTFSQCSNLAQRQIGQDIREKMAEFCIGIARH